jgi:methyltransferase (TIGR00027 family)
MSALPGDRRRREITHQSFAGAAHRGHDDVRRKDGQAMGGPLAGNVRITADALVHLRMKSPLAHRLSIDSPYDRLFLTAAGGDLAKMALSIDPVYEQFNLVRYAWFTHRMSRYAAHYSQIVALGAGYDTRSLALPGLREGRCRVFELDYPDLLAGKRRVLSDNGIALPEGLRYVPCDLNEDDAGARLAAAGFDAATPAAVVMEGVFFFLRGERAAVLLEPASLGLASGSILTFDAWTATRAQRLNDKVARKTGRRLFGDAPLGDSAQEVSAALRHKGYGSVKVTPLDEIARQYDADAIADPMQNSWLVVDARLD